MKFTSISIFLSFIYFNGEAIAQGCNDAGICTFGEDLNIFEEMGPEYRADITYIFGLGENENLVNTLQLDQSFRILKGKGSISVRLPFTYVYGVLGQTAGLGDLTAVFDYRIFQKDETGITLSGGTKIPSDKAGKSIDGKGLPMAYQSSLGTYDLLAGGAVTYRKWRFSAAYQKPLNHNENSFLHEYWEDDPDAMEYFESNQLRRGDDALIRVDRDFTVRERSKLKATLMAIYRVQEDRIVRDDEWVSLDGSDGITLNAALGYTLAGKSGGSWNFLIAAPIVTREYRSDGLTRTFVLSIAHSFPAWRMTR